MYIFRAIARTSFAIAIFSTPLPAFAQRHPNVSDITGPNVSDITGPNVSDVTGPNVSDITGPNVSDITGTDTASDKARRAAAAGLDNESADQLAEDLGSAFAVCEGGGDCTTFYALLEQANSILAE